MLTATWQYAVRALVHLAMVRGKGPVLASHIAELEGIPLPFLSKILHQLKVSGIVVASRGQKGGYILQRDPAKLTLLDVAHLTDHVDFGEQCLLGYRFCDETCHCVLHKKWESVKVEIRHFLASCTIDQLAKDQARMDLDIGGMMRFRQPPLRVPYEVAEGSFE